MTTLTETQYSRRIRIDEHFYEIRPGDLVDNSYNLEPDWCTVERIGRHGEDRDIEDAPEYCDGTCVAVIFFEADACAFAFHILPGDVVYARFPVGGDA
jgi:hypothetical protein